MKIISQIILMLCTSLMYLSGVNAAALSPYISLDALKVVGANPELSLIPICYNPLIQKWQVLVGMKDIVVQGDFEGRLNEKKFNAIELGTLKENRNEMPISEWKKLAKEQIMKIMDQRYGIAVDSISIDNAYKVAAVRHNIPMGVFYVIEINFSPSTKPQLIYEKIQVDNAKILQAERKRRGSLIDSVREDLIVGNNVEKILKSLKFAGIYRTVDVKWVPINEIMPLKSPDISSGVSEILATHPNFKK